MKIRPLGAELFRAARWSDGRADRYEANSCFSHLFETHKMEAMRNVETLYFTNITSMKN
jgi:hypothetical protein